MTQGQLDRAVAAATGESLAEVRRLGFSLANPLDVDFDPQPSIEPQIVDWDRLQDVQMPRQNHRRNHMAA